MDDTQSIDLNLPKEKVYFVRTPVFKRIIAFIVDLMIFDFIIGPLKTFVEGYSGLSALSDITWNSPVLGNPPYLVLASLTIIIGFIFFLYNFILQYYLGQTLGMMILNIRLVNVGAIERAKRSGQGASMRRELDDLTPRLNRTAKAEAAKSGKKTRLPENPEEDDTDADQNISRKQYISAVPTSMQIFMRNIIFIPILPFVLFWILEPIYMLVKKERLLDKWVRIGVVEEFQMR